MSNELAASVRPGSVPAGPVVADSMIRFPKVCGTGTTVERAREYLRDDHVHAVLIVDDGRLVAVVERVDLPGAPDRDPAWPFGLLGHRVVRETDDLAATTRRMAYLGRRRFAVVDDDGLLVGLLCRKRSGHGYCSDDGVAARATDRSR